MLLRLVPEISPLYAFCDVGVVVGEVVAVGIGDSRSWVAFLELKKEKIPILNSARETFSPSTIFFKKLSGLVGFFSPLRG